MTWCVYAESRLAIVSLVLYSHFLYLADTHAVHSGCANLPRKFLNDCVSKIAMANF